jgi:dipeptidyl aminopeptidase/acylaminoacyl peptidase
MEWNEQISKDWGGCSKRLSSAIDDVSKESYVDNARLGCVGASYGGYSAFYLPEYTTIVLKRSLLTMAFSTQSMFGTTEEVFFSNWDFGPYWEKTML